MPKLALISVSNKEGLPELLPELKKHDFEFISTGGTAKFIKEAGFEVKDISEVTGSPEMMDGRVKTLNPKIHAGILANRQNESHINDAKSQNIELIDLVIVNLYPFIEKPGIENIDIGGPTMLRAAAKNHDSVTSVTDPTQYDELIENLNNNNGETDLELRKKFAAEVFAHTSCYDSLIAKHLKNGKTQYESIPLIYQSGMRYGENPHQQANLFRDPGDSISGVANAEQLQGKELSYNNYIDLDAAWNIVSEFDQTVPCVSVIKHTSPCGVAIAPSVSQAYQEAFHADSLSAFGGIVASNQTVDLDAANEMTQIFLEAIIAPDFTEEALQIFKNKKNLRLLKINFDNKNNQLPDIKRISGGYLVQDYNDFLLDPQKCSSATQKKVTDEEWIDLIFAWKVVKHCKSNAIVTALGGRTLGIGSGQTNRVGAVELAMQNFNLDTRGAVLASDGFFPFPDSIHLAAQNHISAIIQPGGSIKDEEVIKACDELGIAMVLTNCRHFKH